MTEYDDGILRKLIRLECELDFEHRCFICTGGKSINSENGEITARKLYQTLNRYCKYIFSNNLIGLCRDRIKEVTGTLMEGLFYGRKDKPLPSEWLRVKGGLDVILKQAEVLN